MCLTEGMPKSSGSRARRWQLWTGWRTAQLESSGLAGCSEVEQERSQEYSLLQRQHTAEPFHDMAYGWEELWPRLDYPVKKGAETLQTGSRLPRGERSPAAGVEEETCPQNSQSFGVGLTVTGGGLT